jgi:hypothetical protein
MYLEDGGFSEASITYYMTTQCHFMFILSFSVYRGWEETARLNKMLWEELIAFVPFSIKALL